MTGTKTMIRLMDGGMGQELRRRSAAPDHPLWSAKQMLDEPHLVRELHEEFLRAGAEIIITNTYATTRWRMNTYGEWERYGEANRAACAAAEAARDAVNPGALIAGSLPPLRGSYRPDRALSEEQSELEYAEQAAMLAPSVDFFIAETMTTVPETRGAVKAARALGKPVWVAFSVPDAGEPALRGGASLTEAVRAVDELNVEAFLINCSRPEMVTKGLPELMRAAAGRPVGAYANGFVEIPGEFGTGKSVADIMVRTDLTPETYADHAIEWLDQGATIVGGCCEVGPAHIARLAEIVTQRRSS